jgi:hypothetical protein
MGWRARLGCLAYLHTYLPTYLPTLADDDIVVERLLSVGLAVFC